VPSAEVHIAITRNRIMVCTMEFIFAEVPWTSEGHFETILVHVNNLGGVSRVVNIDTLALHS